MKTNLLIGILCIFILTSATAGANVGNASSGSNPPILSHNLSFSSINLSGEVTYFLSHTSDHSGGNWIALGSPSERRIQLPQPISITYSGPRSLNRGNISGNLSFSNDENYTLNYPSTPDYTTLPVYLPGENVTMSFFGDSALKGNVSVYVLNISSTSAKGILEVLSTGNIKSLRSTFNDTIGGNYTNYSAVLGENGDLLNYDLGGFGPGQYGIVLIQKNNDSSLTVLSATAFVVAEYDLKVTAPASIKAGNNLDISMAFNGTSGNDSNNFTYGAVLVNEQAYRAIIEIDSNGTINGTSVMINGEHFTDKLDINASNYKSKLTKNELQKEIQKLIGEGNGTIAVGEVGQQNLSLTTFDLAQGHYYLFAGAYDPKGMIAGLSQLDFEINQFKPVANFSNNATIGYVPLSVQFNDSSENANGWYWDFGDGTNSSEANPVHTFTSAGNYIVNLTASNSNGTNTKSTTIYLMERPPEPSGNIGEEDSLQGFASGGNFENFSFSSGSTPIFGISFFADQTLGYILVTIDALTGQSSLAPKLLVGGSVYQYFDIWVSNSTSADSDNFSNANISFKVAKTWVEDNNINISTIRMIRYHNGTWNPLQTNLTGQDDANYLFIAQTPGFSPFVITGEHMPNIPDNGTSYRIFKSVVGVDESGDCIINEPRDVLQYRVVVKNEGKTNLTNISVNDSLINLTGPIGNGTEERILMPEDTWEYTGNYSVTAADITNGTIINNASVKCNQLNEIYSNVSTPVTLAKDLQIYKSVTGIDEAGDRMVNKVGDIIQYLVAVKNTGDVNLTNVTIADPLVNLTKSSGDQKNPGVLNPGETWMFIGNYTVTESDISTNGNDSGLITNTATVSCSELSSRNSTQVLPIVKTFIITKPDYPVADFSTSVTSGYAPLPVQFTDKSQNATTWSWDFNGDGVVDSSEQNPLSYTYTTAGIYAANLTVSNANGSDSKVVTITVQKTITDSSSESSSSGGSSSGGSGGSSGASSSGGSGSSSGSGSTGSHNTVNNTTSTQVPSKVGPQNEKGAKAGTGNNSQANNDDGTVKIASFLIGLLVILLAGALILKKIGPKQEK